MTSLSPIIRRICLCIFVTLLALTASHAEEKLNQFSLSSLHDWGTKKGFFVIIDNRFDGSNPSPLASARLLLAVGTGSNWSMLPAPDALEIDRTYEARIELSPEGSHIFLDGQLAARARRSVWAPLAGDLSANAAPEWASHPAAYRVRQLYLRLSGPDGVIAERRFAEAGDASAVQAFRSALPEKIPLSSPPPALTIELAFQLLPPLDLRALSPLVDKFGQPTFADYPGKVHDDAEFAADLADENRRLDTWEKEIHPFDRFGGRTDLGWREEPAGFYRVTRRGDHWWLVSPEGNPAFFTSIGNAPAIDWDATPVTGREFLFAQLPPHTGPTAAAWSRRWGDGRDYVAHQAWNLYRKFGDDFVVRSTAHTVRRVRSWGFSGMGKWTNIDGQIRIPVLNRDGVPRLLHHPDIFNPAVRKRFLEVLQRQVSGHENDPLILGWSVGNEYDEIVRRDEIRHVLALTGSSLPPAKRALIEHALSTLHNNSPARAAAAWGTTGASTLDDLVATSITNLPEDDLQVMRAHFGDTYFAWVYATMKRLAPHHLYFGHWILPGWWEDESDWDRIAAHCDVLGFDVYEHDFDHPQLRQLLARTTKPVFCGEFSFPPYHDGRRGFGHFKTAVNDEAATGRLYADWVRKAAAHPLVVGFSYFQYRDQPITGRGPVTAGESRAVIGENDAFGLITTADSPKWETIEPLRAANLQAALWRMTHATGKN